MRVRHLNCGTMCPVSARLVAGEGGFFAPARMVCHVLLLERDDGLVLVDTGLGTDDVADAKTRLGKEFEHVARPRLSWDETALAQIEALGYRRSDVRHVVPTHLDLDHAGGLSDFPQATVHVFAAEHEAALARPTFGERRRYRAPHFAHGPKWKVHGTGGDSWFGFESVRALGSTGERRDEGGDVLLVPLVGHSRGHCGVAVRTAEGWLLHAGDAYFAHTEMDPVKPYCPPGLRAFQWLAQVDGDARHANQKRLRDLARDHAAEVTVFSAHSPVEYDRLASRVVGADPRRRDGVHAPS